MREQPVIAAARREGLEVRVSMPKEAWDRELGKKTVSVKPN